MSIKFIRASAGGGKVIVSGDQPVKNIHFQLIQLAAGESTSVRLAEFECVAVVLSGMADIHVDGQAFSAVGRRADIWSGEADSVYCGRDRQIDIVARSAVEIALAGGRTQENFPPFRVLPEEVDCVDVGSNEMKSRRRIYHILGHNGIGRCGNLLVSELYCDEGCWSGYPPHKHDTDSAEESAHEELYLYRFNPPAGFGAQFWYEKSVQGDIDEHRVEMTCNGDTFCFSSGYHPAVTSPGHAEYIFTILVGKTQRSLVQNFDETHRYMLDRIPGIVAMRAKFK